MRAVQLAVRDDILLTLIYYIQYCSSQSGMFLSVFYLFIYLFIYLIYLFILFIFI